VGIQMTRSRRTPVWDSFWAEDGRFFYGEARNHGFWHTVFEPLDGYLQVVPRLVASIAAAAPLVDAALVNALLAATTVALLGLYVFIATADVLAHTWQRVAAAAVVVAHPAAAFEVNAADNNLHWFFMIAAFWACWSRGRTKRRTTLDTTVVVLAALSDPLTGLLLPLVAWRAWRGDRGARVMTAGLVVALALQGWLGLRSGAPEQTAGGDYDAIPGVYGLRVVGSFLVGDHGVQAYWSNRHTWVLAALALAAVGVGFAAAVIFSRGRERRLLVALLAYSIAFFAAPLATRGGADGYLRQPLTLNGSRYTIAPLAFLYFALIVAAGLPWPLPGRLRGRVLPALSVLLIGIQLAGNYAVLGPRTSGVSWHQQVVTARAGCLAHVTGTFPGPQHGFARPRIYHGVLQMPQSPFNSRYFWAVPLHCADVE
jgi:hypothetical protein